MCIRDRINKNSDGSIDQALSYDDLIRSMKYNEVDTNNHNKTLNEKGLSLDLPINYDMFLNYHRYFWVLDVLPPCELQYTSYVDIDNIIGLVEYTTPTMKNGRTLTFENGMRIKLAPHTVNRFTQTVNGNTTFTATVTSAARVFVFVNNTRIDKSAFTYNSSTGVVTLTVANHGFTNGDRIKIADGSLTFTCDMDNHATEHAYPRLKDPSNGKWLVISDATTNTFKVNVGQAGASQTYTPTAATYTAATGQLVLTLSLIHISEPTRPY